MNLQAELMKRLEEKRDKMVEIRRYLHAHPELSFQEDNTAKYIADFYQGKDCEIQTNVGHRGIVVTIDSKKPGQTIALRADFDALPIQEENDISYASVNKGCMHACGHDAHTAYLMVLAETLIELKDQLVGKIVILHQDAEEKPPGGAKAMVEAGCLDGVDYVLGAHFWASSPLGEIGYNLGPSTAGRSSFKVKVIGKGGHGAIPQEANDAVVAGSFLVSALQTIISRRISPFNMATLTVGSFDGAGSPNVIKDTITLQGDIRVMDDETKEIIRREFKNILDGLKIMFSVDYELFYEDDYPVLISDNVLTEQVVESLEKADIPGVKAIKQAPPSSGSEDFSYYSQAVPSTFIGIGARDKRETFYPHHHPKFDINEDALPIAAKVMGIAALGLLDNKKD